MAKELSTSKTIAELEHLDRLYYIDPKKPTETNHLVVKSITPWEKKSGYFVIEYYKSSAATELLAPEAIEDLETMKIIAEGRAKSFMTASIPPSIYFTSKRAIDEFMKSQL